jgi:AraC-like DNA-binding protein
VRNYLIAVSFTFIIYMAYRIRQYSRWLKQNYADLEHKELWKSLAIMFFILMMLVCYKTNFGGFATEYAIQVMTLVLTGFLVWRVETLQQLGEPEPAAVGKPVAAVAKRPAAPNTEPISALSYIPAKMERVCKEKQIYLQQGLTLMQLSTAVGVNRTYLSKWFAQQGTTFNAYINKLRVEYFMNRYIELMAAEKTFSARSLP